MVMHMGCVEHGYGQVKGAQPRAGCVACADVVRARTAEIDAKRATLASEIDAALLANPDATGCREHGYGLVKGAFPKVGCVACADVVRARVEVQDRRAAERQERAEQRARERAASLAREEARDRQAAAKRLAKAEYMRARRSARGERSMSTIDELDEFTRAYLECALWASTDNGYFGEGDERNNAEGAETGGDPLDDNFDLEDFAPSAVERAVKECRDFRDYCEELGLSWEDEQDDEQAGHDFWLTRNGHGTGFWDRGLEQGDELTKAAQTYGGSDCYVGDDGKVYLT